jgi:hypothetical protein
MQVITLSPEETDRANDPGETGVRFREILRAWALTNGGNDVHVYGSGGQLLELYRGPAKRTPTRPDIPAARKARL